MEISVIVRTHGARWKLGWNFEVWSWLRSEGHAARLVRRLRRRIRDRRTREAVVEDAIHDALCKSADTYRPCLGHWELCLADVSPGVVGTLAAEPPSIAFPPLPSDPTEGRVREWLGRANGLLTGDHLLLAMIDDLRGLGFSCEEMLLLKEPDDCERCGGEPRDVRYLNRWILEHRYPGAIRTRDPMLTWLSRCVWWAAGHWLQARRREDRLMIEPETSRPHGSSLEELLEHATPAARLLALVELSDDELADHLTWSIWTDTRPLLFEMGLERRHIDAAEWDLAKRVPPGQGAANMGIRTGLYYRLNSEFRRRVFRHAWCSALTSADRARFSSLQRRINDLHLCEDLTFEAIAAEFSGRLRAFDRVPTSATDPSLETSGREAVANAGGGPKNPEIEPVGPPGEPDAAGGPAGADRGRKRGVRRGRSLESILIEAIHRSSRRQVLFHMLGGRQ